MKVIHDKPLAGSTWENLPIKEGEKYSFKLVSKADQGSVLAGEIESRGERTKPLLSSEIGDSKTLRRRGKLHVSVAGLPAGLLNLITANFARAFSLCETLTLRPSRRPSSPYFVQPWKRLHSRKTYKRLTYRPRSFQRSLLVHTSRRITLSPAVAKLDGH